jgi:hypothetical protein
MELDGKPGRSVAAGECWSTGQMESVVLDISAELHPPPALHAETPGSIALLRALARNPLAAWTEARFAQPIMPSFRRVVVVSGPAAIGRVLFGNCDNYEKDWRQRRVLSSGRPDSGLPVSFRRYQRQKLMGGNSI